MISENFLTAGKAEFSVSVPEEWAAQRGTKSHYTFLIKKTNNVYFVRTKRGSEFLYHGLYNPDEGTVLLTRRSQFQHGDWETKIIRGVVRAIHQNRENDILDAGWDVMHVGKCGKCRRKLTDPESLARGIGPECYRRLR